jgi:hypothetical protein
VSDKIDDLPTVLSNNGIVVDGKNYLKAASFLFILFSVFAFFFHYVLWGSYLHAGSPAPYLGELPTIFANDITRLMTLSSGFSPYQNIRKIFPYEAVPYPPTAFVIYGVLAKFGGLGAAIIFYSVFIGFYCRFLWLDSAELPLWDRLIFSLAFTFGIYPFFYVLDRGNLDGLVAIFLWGALSIYQKKSRWRNYLPAFLIAVAGSLKIYPILFAIIFLRRRHMRAFLFSCVSFIALTLASALLLHGNLHDQLNGFLGEMRFTKACYQYYNSCLNLSLIYPLKMGIHILFGTTQSVLVFKSAYAISVLLLLVIVSGILLFFEPADPITFSLLTIVVIWIPVMSFDYKLLLLVLPVLMLIKDGRPSFLLLALFLGATLVAKRALGTADEAIINQILLFISFVLCLLLSHMRGIKLADSLAKNINKTVFFALIFAFCFMYILVTARLIIATGFSGDVHLSMSRRDPRGAYGQGWGVFEGDGNSTWRWTDGCAGEIHLKLQPTASYLLNAVVQTHAANPQQVVNVYYNGIKIGEAKLADGTVRRLVFIIPKRLISEEAILPDRLVFRTSSCNPPEINSSTPLGIAVSHIDVTRINGDQDFPE